MDSNTKHRCVLQQVSKLPSDYRALVHLSLFLTLFSSTNLWIILISIYLRSLQCVLCTRLGLLNIERHVIVVATQRLSRDGGMAENHGPRKLGNSSGLGPEVVERQRMAIE